MPAKFCRKRVFVKLLPGIEDTDLFNQSIHTALNTLIDSLPPYSTSSHSYLASRVAPNLARKTLPRQLEAYVITTTHA